MCVSNDAGMFPRDLLSNQIKETLNKARLTALYAICLQIFRHIAQKSLAIRQYACGISRQSAEKSDNAPYAQALCGVAQGTIPAPAVGKVYAAKIMEA